MQYALIHNTDLNQLVALPSTEVLTDLALEKNWRVIHQDMTYTQLQVALDQFTIEVMDPSQFHVEYLADDELTDDDIDYINSCSQEAFYEGSQPDADEEEIDVEFFGEEETVDQED